jgi:hypothetical protein
MSRNRIVPGLPLFAAAGIVLGLSAVVVGALLGGLSGGVTAAFVVGVVVLVGWTLRIYADSHAAWARGLYGDAESEDDHGYAGAVRRFSARSAKGK